MESTPKYEMYERTLLVGGYTDEDENEFMDSMEELKRLAESCYLDVVGMISQKLRSINASTYYGKGKIKEIKQYVEEQEIEIVVLNDNVSPVQMRNIQEIVGCDVIDRHTLILDIFSRRAKTKEAMLQVEIAQLKYLLPRIHIMLSNLNERLGKRGLGEAAEELSRRRIENEIIKKERELEKIVQVRKLQRRKRKKNEVPVVALVGYTNAGKSTLLNAMIDYTGGDAEKKVYTDDRLFATLETTTREIERSPHKKFLVTDTVGFVSRLPHGLVKAFRSTLEEVTEADLILHVIDLYNPHFERQKKVTLEVLKDIGVEDVSIIPVYNKMDRVKEPLSYDGIHISAKTKEGFDRLFDEIERKLFPDYQTARLFIPFHAGNIYHELKKAAYIIEEEYHDTGYRLLVELNKIQYERYKQYIQTSL